MEPCVLIASSCDSISPHEIVIGILEKDELPEALKIVDGVSSYPWHIDTKYYEADVHVCAMHEKTIGNQAFADSVNAVILCFDSLSESKLEPVEQWLSFTKEFEADIKILICDSCHSDNDFSNSTKTTKPGVSRLEAQRWCVGNGFELVELNPDQSEVDSDVEDDFQESVGIKRVIQALHAHIWPKLKLKDSPRARLPPSDSLITKDLINTVSTSPETEPIDNSVSCNKTKEVKVARVKPIPKVQQDQNNDEHGIGTESRLQPSRTESESQPHTPLNDSTPESVSATTKKVVAVHPFHVSAPGDSQSKGSSSSTSSSSQLPNSEASSTQEKSGLESADQEKGKEKEERPSTDPPSKEERIDSMLEAIDSMSDGTFEELFLNLSAMKSKASNLSPTHRKEYAEKMAMAFWKSIGGNEAEAEAEFNSSDED